MLYCGCVGSSVLVIDVGERDLGEVEIEICNVLYLCVAVVGVGSGSDDSNGELIEVGRWV